MVQFLLSLTLTEKGRSDARRARENLAEASAVVVEQGGTVGASFMTFGDRDAVIVGEMGGVEALASVTAWIQDQGYLTTSTTLGIEATSYTPATHK